MRRTLFTCAAAILVMGWVVTLAFFQSVQAGQASHDVVVDPPANSHTTLPAEPLDCAGTTGNMGCGPGWFWRDGWRGWACYPC